MKAFGTRDIVNVHDGEQNNDGFADNEWEANHGEPSWAVPQGVGAETPGKAAGEKTDPHEESLGLCPSDTAAEGIVRGKLLSMGTNAQL